MINGRAVAGYYDEDQLALRQAAVGDSALCTVVGIDGSFSRRLGAQLAVGRDGTVFGSLSDSCLDKELASQATSALEEGRPRALRYGKGSPFIDFRLPCGSGLDILIDPFPDIDALVDCVVKLDRRQRSTLKLPCEAPGLLQTRDYLPSPRLVVFGDTAEATALKELCVAFGTEVQCIQPGRDIFLGKQPSGIKIDTWTAIVLLFHDHEWETAILEWATLTEAFYIGAIGGQATRTNRHEALARAGLSPELIGKVRSSIGLIPAARNPRVLALGVLTEIIRDYGVFWR
jgi:xanthine dehydrogenase accessory factor